jgi:hypothetical protein
LNHLPENTDIRFVFVKMDDMLDKQAMSSYISQYQNLRKIEKSKKRREDEQLARIYKRNGGDNTSGNLNRHHDDDFVYIPPGIGPKIKVDELETEESYERNKNNPELYPSLKTEKSEEDEGFHPLSTTNKHLAGNAVQKIFEMEEKKMQEKIRKLSANQPVREEEPTEEDFEREFQANSIVIIKKPSKKKKGRK